MKKALLVFSLILFIGTHQAIAQDSLRSSFLGLSVGTGQLLNKDQFQSPFTYKGNNLFFQANYALSTSRGQHIVDFSYSTGTIKSVISPAAQNKLLVLKYAYLFRLGNNHAPLTTHLGAGVSTLGSITNYLPGIESPKTYITSSTALTLNGKLSYTPTPIHQLLLDATLPIASFVYRPDFDINGKGHTGITSMAKNVGLIANLGYEYNLNRKYKLALNYQYTYFTYAKPRPISILQNGVTVGFKKQFKRNALVMVINTRILKIVANIPFYS